MYMHLYMYLPPFFPRGCFHAERFTLIEGSPPPKLYIHYIQADMNQARALASALNHVYGKAGCCWKLRWIYPPKSSYKHGMERGRLPGRRWGCKEGMQGV